MSQEFFGANSNAREMYLAALACMRRLTPTEAAWSVTDDERVRLAFALGCVEYDSHRNSWWMHEIRCRMSVDNQLALAAQVREICEATHCDVPAWAELPTVVEPDL